MAQLDLFRTAATPWNARRIIGPMPPFKPKHVWAICQQLKSAGRVRDLALFDCAIDAKLRGCDLVKLTVSDVAPVGSLRERATVIQQKTGRPVPFEITDPPAMHSMLGSRAGRGARTIGYSLVAADLVITSALASTPGWSTDGSRWSISNRGPMAPTACAEQKWRCSTRRPVRSALASFCSGTASWRAPSDTSESRLMMRRRCLSRSTSEPKAISGCSQLPLGVESRRRLHP
jgi:hypothetical protein